MRIVLACTVLLFSAILSAGAAIAKDCDFTVPPGGLPAKAKSGCTAPTRSREPVALKQQGGFIDLGNGTKVRISGRVQVDVGVKR